MERNTSSHNTISRIDFGLLGMPTRIQFTNGSVTEYIYAADGTKLRTIHRTSVNGPAIPYGTRHTLTNQETLSLDSITYIDGLEIDKFFNCKYYFDNGYLTLGNTGSGEYHYTIKDHLGNIRTVVDASGSAEQVNNYYAYGGLLNDVPASVDVQTHKYNGKELDLMHGLNEYDYGARQYDPAIALFTTVDPLCEKYYNISPYVYCGGNPVNRVDPDGKDWYKVRATGQYVYDKSLNSSNFTTKYGWKNYMYIGKNAETPNGRYLSLFGENMDASSSHAQLYKHIENAFVNYENVRNGKGAYDSEDFNIGKNIKKIYMQIITMFIRWNMKEQK